MQISVLRKTYIVSAVFNCKWYYKNRLMKSYVFIPSAVVTHIIFYIFHLIVSIY